MKYVHIILISDLWEKYHRKEFLKSISRELSSWSDVVVIQLPVSLFVHPFTNFKRFIKRIQNIINNKNKEYDDGVLILTPILLFHYLLWNKSNILFKLDYMILNYQINKFINRKYGDRQKVLWVFFPYLHKLALKYREKNNFVIYDQYDLYNYDISGNELEEISERNSKLIKICNLVFCTTEFIYNYSKNINDNSYYITNGNNFGILNNEESIKRKTISSAVKTVGYLGGIRNWLDFELLEYAVSNLSEVDFLFIGKIYKESVTQMQSLCEKKNVRWIDYIPQEKLSLYLAKFDVGIIPFKNNIFFSGVFPNKFYEYLAAGIPVVSTPLPELYKYKESICISENKQEFLRNITCVLNGEYGKYRNENIELARKNSWEQKALEWNVILKKSFL
jgi:teichuronic acid biosynthesis glycosyltransferase TuaH